MRPECLTSPYESYTEVVSELYSNFRLILDATLHFIFVTDGGESELAILDLIQVFVQVLDRCFENVCELDIIFNFNTVHAILSEMVMGGMVIETNVNSIVAAFKQPI